MRIVSRIVAFVVFIALAMSTSAFGASVVLTGDQPEDTPYPYTLAPFNVPGGSFEVELDAEYGNETSLFVGNTTITPLAIKRSTTAGNGDRNQINPGETLIMTFKNFDGVGSVEFNSLSGAGSYFDPGTTLELYKNGVLVNSIPCDGSSSYSIIPAIVAEEGDVISFTPVGLQVRLSQFELDVIEGFPASDEPYIADGAVKEELLNYTIPSDGAGHYFLTGDWSGVTHKPDGVVVKVGRGNATDNLYYLGATGPDTAAVDFDLRILEPGDTVKVVAGLTGAAGEDSGLWNVSLDQYDSWSGSRYQVPVVPVTLASPVADLDIHQDLWPKNTGFRNDYRGGQGSLGNYVSEALGHAPKAYSEELAGSWQNRMPMNDYAQQNPNWRAMLHWNGELIRFFWHDDYDSAGEPVLGTDNDLPELFGQFKPYHFRYEVGTYLSAAVQDSAVTTFTVDDPLVWDEALVESESTGGAKRNVAIVIPVDPVTGERQFDQSELVTVMDINGNQLTVKRDIYINQLDINSPGYFPAGSYIAPAAMRLSGLFTGGLEYNLSLSCPVDELGRNGADMLAEMLSYEFRTGGNLQYYHGIMFDVMQRSARSDEDGDLDGIVDGGLDPRGYDLFHLGVQSFAHKLRAALPTRIFTFDGQTGEWPALQTVFNGVESEGFSNWNDAYTERWSSALNYRLFVDQWNQSEVRWDLVVPKLGNLPDGDPMESALKRYSIAAATALKLGVSHQNVEDENGAIHAIDETRNGVEGQLQWLGAPMGDLIRPALLAPDELSGAGLPAVGWSSPDGSAVVSSDPEGILVSADGAEHDDDMTVEFPGITIPEGDLFIRFEGKGGLAHMPSDTARNIRIELNGGVDNGLTFEYLEGPVNSDGFTELTGYFRSKGAVGGSTVTLRLIAEGAKDLTLRNFTIHNAADVLIREFENGLVLANPSENPYNFDLSSLFPGQHFRHIQGQSYDDPVVNDGTAINGSVTLDGFHGLFLVKDIVDIIDFDRAGITSNENGRSPDVDGEFGDVWNFSEATPMISSLEGNNTTIYGGAITGWGASNSTYTPTFRYLKDQLQLFVSGPVTSAEGMWVWNKADFLNDTDSKYLSLTEGDMLTCDFALTGTSEYRFVVKEAGVYYVSEASASGGSFTLDPTTSNWAPINTADYSIGNYTAHTFTDVDAVGVYYSAEREGSFTNTKLSSFDLTVWSGSLSDIEPNHAPTWNSDPVVEVAATEDAAYSATLADDAFDANAGASLTFAKVSGAAWLTVASDGTLSGTPTNDDVGANSFTVSVSDGIAPAVEATLDIVVANVNDAPTWNNNPINAAATEDAPYSGSISGEANDVDAGASLTFAKVSGAAWLTVASDGTLSGTPTNGNVGTNVFTVSVSDNIASPVEVTLNIDVSNVNDAPTWNNDPIAITATEDAAFSASLSAEASDVDIDAILTFTKVSGRAWLNVAGDGTLSGTPGNADVGANSFTVSVSDGIAPAVQATLNIDVSNVNDDPVFSVDPINKPSVTEGEVYSDTLAGSATDEDVGDSLSYSKLSGPAWLNIASDGTLSGTPGVDDPGANTWIVQASDGNGGTDSATLEITVLDAVPEPVTDPYPADGATGVSVDADLSWVSSEGATSFNLRFGDTASPVPYIGNQSATTYDPGTLAYDTTYYWLVVPINGSGSGDWTIWSFTTEQELVEVVDFDRTGFGNTAARNADETSSTNAVWTFSDTVPLMTSTAGTNATVYGGVVDTWSMPTNYTPQLRFYKGDEIQNQNNPPGNSDTTATGMMVWKKEDFLNGTSTQTVSLASGGTLACEVRSLSGTGQIRFVVREGGSYYVSEASASSLGVFSVESSQTLWAPVSTADYSIGNYISNSFTDVEAVGYYYSSARSGGQINVRIGGFNLTVPRSGLSENAAPDAPTGLGAVAGIGSVALDWDDNSDSDLASYTVYRSETSGSGYASIATGLTASDYVDNNVTDHTTYYYVVKAMDTLNLESGASAEVSATPGFVANLVGSDMAVLGSVSGTLADADVNDDAYQAITEVVSNNTSALEHKWVFDVTAAELVTFYVEAHHSANSEGDDMVFAYSTDDVNYTDMVTITKTNDDNTAQFYALPSGLSGTVYVRVVDADRTDGNTALDSVSVDAIFIVSEESTVAPAVAMAPVPADGAVDVALDVQLGWTAGLMTASHDVYFGTTASPTFQGNQSGTTFDPGTLLNSTTYYWAVDEVNNSGTTVGSAWSFTTAAANVAPSVSIVDPLDGETFPVGTSLYVNADASDADGSVDNVRLYVNGQFVRQENIVPYEWGSPSQNDALLQNLGAGAYVLEVVATDNEGASATNSISVTVAQSWTELTFDDFEAGFGNWVDGGSDMGLTSVNAIGTQCMGMQDNSGDASAGWLANSLDLTGYSELKIEFTYMVVSFETGEDFLVEYSDDGGSTWSTIKDFVVDVDFSNDVREYPVLTIDSGSYSFTSNVKIKIRCDASGNQDDLYVDDVSVSAR